MDEFNSKTASLLTLSATIKIIVINKRQVTLSNFRQFINEDVISDPWNPDFKGDPWGTVNYRFGECKDTPQEHYHLVWSRPDGGLRRCCFPQPRNFAEPFRHHVNQCYEFRGCRATLEALAAGQHGNRQSKLSVFDRVAAGHDYRGVTFDGDSYYWYKYVETISGIRRLIAHLRSLPDGLIARLEGLHPTNNFGECVAAIDLIEPYVNHMEEIMYNNYKNVYDKVSRMDQLFIAV